MSVWFFFVSVPPKILMPDHVHIKAGKKLRIEAHVYGKPQPVCKWLKGDQDVLTSSRLAVHKTEKSSVLIIKDVTRKDSDFYTLTAENSSGTDSQKIRVIVMGMFHFIIFKPNFIQNQCIPVVAILFHAFFSSYTFFVQINRVHHSLHLIFLK